MIEQWQLYLNCHQSMGILLLKMHIICDKCSVAIRQHTFGVFAIEEAPSPLPALYATLVTMQKSEFFQIVLFRADLGYGRDLTPTIFRTLESKVQNIEIPNVVVNSFI